MNRKFVLSASIAACVWGGITMAEACSGCGCSSTKKSEPHDGPIHGKHLTFDQTGSFYSFLPQRTGKYDA